MTQIVKGLRYHYTTEQLCTHMLQRGNYHDERAKQKEGTLPDLKNAVETVKAAGCDAATHVAAMSKFNTNYNFDAGDQVEALENDIKDHRNKALVFRTLAEHLVPNATYDLEEAELRRLEIIK